MGFCHTDSVVPWSGFTAQVSASLKRPIHAGSVLMLRASVDRVEGRKVSSAFLRELQPGWPDAAAPQVWVTCELVDPASGSVHCSGGGLYLKMKEGSGGGGGATTAALEAVGT